MNCPYCGKDIPTKARGIESKYREDVRRAEQAIGVLDRVPYPELYEACRLEKIRLQRAISNPALLYSIYRRADKKTPVAYGMSFLEQAA